MLGTVKRFHGAWGFIIPDDGSEEVFLHWTRIVKAYPTERAYVNQGDRVECEILKDPRGPRACGVRKIDYSVTFAATHFR